MNNRDWLYTLQPRDLARWFDAEHVEPNDNLSPDNGVSEGKADANDAKKVSTTPLNVPNVIKWQYMDGSEHVQELTNDSREKLLYDASELVADCAPSGEECDPMFRAIVELLDRQAAITERDCAECAEGLGSELDARCDPLKERIAELQAKVDELNKKWADANMRCAEANAEAERWRQKASAVTLGASECENANDVMKSGEIGFRCSECGSWDDDPRPRFCHNCGRKVKR